MKSQAEFDQFRREVSLATSETSAPANIELEDSKSMEAELADLKARVAKLEAILGSLLADPEIKRKYDDHNAKLRGLLRDDVPPELIVEVGGMEAARQLWEYWKDYRRDPVAFENQMKKEDPRVQAGWRAFKEDWEATLIEMEREKR